MPITFVPGPGGIVLGPGVPIVWGSDFIGPLPTGSTWDLHWFEGAEPQNFWLFEQIFNPFVNRGQSIPFVQDPQKSSMINVNATIRTGAPAHLTVELRTPTGVVDSGTANANWDTSAGIAQQLLIGQQAVAGGFTQTDRDTILATQVNTMAALPTQLPIGAIRNIPLGQLVKGPPDELLRRAETLLLSGEGSLTRTSATASVNAYGAVWDFNFVPEGFGFALGPIREYDRRMAQFAIIGKDAQSNQFTEDLVDVHSSFGKVRFPISIERIDYKIAPGVVLAWTWLVFVVAQ